MATQGHSYLVKTIAFIAILAALSGCETGTPSSEKVIADLRAALGEAQERLNELAPTSEDVQKVAAQEVGRLYAIEYKVVPLNPSASAAELEQQLSTLGKERWECGQPFRAVEELRLVCRRLPLSYLKFLAQFTRIM